MGLSGGLPQWQSQQGETIAGQQIGDCWPEARRNLMCTVGCRRGWHHDRTAERLREQAIKMALMPFLDGFPLPEINEKECEEEIKGGRRREISLFPLHMCTQTHKQAGCYTKSI